MKITVEVEFQSEAKALKFIKKLTQSKICQDENDTITVKTTVKSDDFRHESNLRVQKELFNDSENGDFGKKLALDIPPGEGVGGGERVRSATSARHKATSVAVPSLNQELDSNNKEINLNQGMTACLASPAQAKRVSVPDLSATKFEVSPGSQIRTMYMTLYSERYGKLAVWGARENGQATYLLKQIPLREALELIPAYFEWQNAQVIRAGHPFGMGYSSFMQRYSELRADLVAPERHAVAYAIEGRMRESNKNIEGSMNVDMAMKQMRSEQKKIEGSR